jgi:hypothetical protein
MVAGWRLESMEHPTGARRGPAPVALVSSCGQRCHRSSRSCRSLVGAADLPVSERRRAQSTDWRRTCARAHARRARACRAGARTVLVAPVLAAPVLAAPVLVAPVLVVSLRPIVGADVAIAVETRRFRLSRTKVVRWGWFRSGCWHSPSLSLVRRSRRAYSMADDREGAEEWHPSPAHA